MKERKRGTEGQREKRREREREHKLRVTKGQDGGDLNTDVRPKLTPQDSILKGEQV